jgi:hypothetical protein
MVGPADLLPVRQVADAAEAAPEGAGQVVPAGLEAAGLPAGLKAAAVAAGRRAAAVPAGSRAAPVAVPAG